MTLRDPLREMMAGLQGLLREADDGAVVDGDEVALNRDVRDPKIARLADALTDLANKLRDGRRAIAQYQRLVQSMTILPEDDPRTLDGLLTEMDIDVDTIAQAMDRLSPRLENAISVVGPADRNPGKKWV